jgi:3-dehydroquinate dehydratase
MESQFIHWFVTGVLGVVTYLVKRTIDAYDEKIKQQDKDIAEIRRDYLHRDDFKEFKLELRMMFDEIKADIRELKNKG